MFMDLKQLRHVCFTILLKKMVYFITFWMLWYYIMMFKYATYSERLLNFK